MDIPPVSIPLRVASETVLSTFLRVSLVASTAPFSFLVVEERDLEAAKPNAGVAVLTGAANREVKGINRVSEDMLNRYCNLGLQ